MKLKAIKSLDSFPASQRLHMIYNMAEQTLDIYKEGRDAKEEEAYSALWQYHQALNEAEKQIEFLLKMIHDLMDEGQCIDIDKGYPAYLEEYPTRGDEDLRYKMEEMKEAFFVASAKKDPAKMSKYINQIIILDAKLNRKEDAA